MKIIKRTGFLTLFCVLAVVLSFTACNHKAKAETPAPSPTPAPSFTTPKWDLTLKDSTNKVVDVSKSISSSQSAQTFTVSVSDDQITAYAEANLAAAKHFGKLEAKKEYDEAITVANKITDTAQKAQAIKKAEEAYNSEIETINGLDATGLVTIIKGMIEYSFKDSVATNVAEITKATITVKANQTGKFTVEAKVPNMNDGTADDIVAGSITFEVK